VEVPDASGGVDVPGGGGRSVVVEVGSAGATLITPEPVDVGDTETVDG